MTAINRAAPSQAVIPADILPQENQAKTNNIPQAPGGAFADKTLFNSADQVKAQVNSVLLAKNDAVKDSTDNIPAFKNQEASQFVRDNRSRVAMAAQRNGLQAETVGAIMFQERRYYGYDDIYQDAAAKDWLRLKDQGKELEAGAFWVQLAATGKGNPEANTFGKAQIRLDNLKSLISEGRLSNLISPEKWNSLNEDGKTREAIRIVLNDAYTPDIIGAWAGKVKQDYLARGGSPLMNGPRGEYKLLTSLYSQYSPGSSPIGQNPDIKHLPEWGRSLNKSGRDAVSNYGVIWKALYSDAGITGFKGSRLPENLRYDPSEPLRGGSGRRLGE